MARSYLRCRAPDCRRVFGIDSDTEEGLLEAWEENAGLRLGCPSCRLSFLYRASDMIPGETAVTAVSSWGAAGAPHAALAP